MTFDTLYDFICWAKTQPRMGRIDIRSATELRTKASVYFLRQQKPLEVVEAALKRGLPGSKVVLETGADGATMVGRR